MYEPTRPTASALGNGAFRRIVTVRLQSGGGLQHKCDVQNLSTVFRWLLPCDILDQPV
jgi:hypothetical protein